MEQGRKTLQNIYATRRRRKSRNRARRNKAKNAINLQLLPVCVLAFIASVCIENTNKSVANELGALKSCTCLLNGEWKTGLVEPRSHTW